MDLSKLPKLSQTTTRRNDGPDPPAPRSPEPPYDRGSIDRAEPFPAMEIFLAIGVGLLFMLLGMSYGKYAWARATGGTYPTGVVWQAGHPKEGQPVAPEDLQGDYRKGFDQKMLSDSSLFVFGAGIGLAGLLLIVTQVRPVPFPFRKAAAVLAVAATSLGLLYALWAIAGMMRDGTLPQMTLVAVLVGGMSLFMQVGLVRAMGPSRSWRPTHAGNDARPTGPSPGDRPPSATPTIAHRLAHERLRIDAFDNPRGLVGTLQGPGGLSYLCGMWIELCKWSGLPFEPQLPPLDVETTQVGPYSAVIVTLPPPTREGEAYFVGIVLRSYVRQDGAVIERQPVVLYYLLEAVGGTPNGPPAAAALCEWQAGDHVRFAEVVEPRFDAFRSAMGVKVQARQEAEDRLSATV